MVKFRFWFQTKNIHTCECGCKWFEKMMGTTWCRKCGAITSHVEDDYIQIIETNYNNNKKIIRFVSQYISVLINGKKLYKRND